MPDCFMQSGFENEQGGDVVIVGGSGSPGGGVHIRGGDGEWLGCLFFSSSFIVCLWFVCLAGVPLPVLGGNVVLEAGSANSTSYSGLVQARGSSFQVCPNGPGASRAKSVLQMGTRSDMSAFYAIEVDDDSLSIANSSRQRILTLPASPSGGPFAVDNSMTVLDAISVTAQLGQATVSVQTALQGS